MSHLALCDAKGYLLTGRDLVADPRYATSWKKDREPYLLGNLRARRLRRRRRPRRRNGPRRLGRGRGQHGHQVRAPVFG
ncbi:MAG: hypothetical protein WKG07_14620 [Hymenobacter sp.]